MGLCHYNHLLLHGTTHRPFYKIGASMIRFDSLIRIIKYKEKTNVVFWLIVLGVGIILIVLGIRLEDELVAIPGIVFFCLGVIWVLGGFVTASMTKSEIIDMRENPAIYSIFDKHDINKTIKKAKGFQGTIFSFYNGFDLTYIEEN